MQHFARRSIEVLATQSLPLNVVTTTVHGSGYGLDGGESLQRLILGLEEGLSEAPSLTIEKIVFLTLGERSERTLASVLENMNLPQKMRAGRISPAAAHPGKVVKADGVG